MGFGGFNRRQVHVLTVLMLVNFVYYVNRQIIFSQFPDTRRDFSLSFVNRRL